MANSKATLSMAVIRLLVDQKLNLSDIAEILGLQNSEMTRINRGEREFKANHLLVLARHLKLHPAALLAKAMAPFAEPAMAGDALGKLISDVADEVAVVLQKRKQPPALGRKQVLVHTPIERK